MTPKSAPLYYLLQRLRDSFYGLELHLERYVPLDEPHYGEQFWRLTVNGEPVKGRWDWLPEHDRTNDPGDSFHRRWVGMIGERAAQNAVERIERIKAGYAAE